MKDETGPLLGFLLSLQRDQIDKILPILTKEQLEHLVRLFETIAPMNTRPRKPS